MYVPFSSPYKSIINIQVNQAAKGVISCGDALIDLLESIERFVNRLGMYTRIPLTPAMVEIVVKIMVELLSTLALATEEFHERRPSECILADVTPYSSRRSQNCNEILRGERDRSGPAEVGPTHAR
jgi:hypothetical protein